MWNRCNSIQVVTAQEDLEALLVVDVLGLLI